MNIKLIKITFWISTGLIFLTQGVLEAFTGTGEMAKQGIMGLGYPEYFVVMLVVFKVIGATALIVPKVPRFLKEWAYAGFTFDFLAAFISLWVVGGFGMTLLLPLIALAILMVSYITFQKLHPRPMVFSQPVQN